MNAESQFAELIALMARLRGEGGCPWDREQTFQTIKPFLLQETYEVLDAIDREDWPELASELGDLLLQVVFFSQMAQEAGHFSVSDALQAINAKLIRRHPHIFAEETAATEADVRKRWDQIKAGEKKRPAALLDAVPRAMPALVEAEQVSSRAAAKGFDWSNSDQVLQKLEEELGEVAGATTDQEREEEIGDVLFTVVNLARHLKVDPEQALRKANAKFRRRFAHVETGIATSGGKWEDTSLDEMEKPLATGEAVIDIRQLSTPAEMQAAVALQKSIWGFEDIELLPVRLFIVATKIGGHVFGAYDGNTLVGFCLAIPGIKAGAHPYLHSHMLGVARSHRNYGVGRMLKLRQRDDAIARGLQLMEWTFDPLEVKNAYFNIERLGAIVRRFVRNQYGTTTSHLHRGLPTDRCTAEWWMQSERVERVLRGEPLPSPPVIARIAVSADPAAAQREQARVSDQFSEYFERGLAVTGFERSAAEGTYLLSSWPAK